MLELARVGFLASNDLSRAYGAKYGFVVKAENVDGLGDEAWRLWAHGHGREVTYHWRRDDLVTEVHVHCYGDCPDVDADVDAAAHAWADAIDEEARSAGGSFSTTGPGGYKTPSVTSSPNSCQRFGAVR